MRFRSSRWRVASATVAGLLGLALAGCSDAVPEHVLGTDVVYGSGAVVEESRSVAGFTAVVFAGIGKLHIREGGAESLLVRAEDNLIELLETEVGGDTLVIRVRPGYDLRQTREIEFHLVVSDLRRAELTGAGGITGSALTGSRLSLVRTGVGSIDFSGLDVQRLDVNSSGIGTIRVDGTVPWQSVVVGGLGSYDARELQSARADVTIRDSGSATVWVSDRLDARIDGSGSVYYLGNPVVTTSGNGSGSVVSIGS